MTIKTHLSEDGLAALTAQLDKVAETNALMYDELDAIDTAKAVLKTLNGICERLSACLQYIDALRDDFECDEAMTGHEQIIFRLVGQVLRGKA